MRSEQASHPSRRGYAIALTIFLIGSMLAGVLVLRFVTGLMGLTDSLTQAVVPGTTELALSDTGSYTIFYEYESVVNGRVYRTGEAIPALDVSVLSKESGSSVVLTSPGASTSYTVGNRAGVSVLEFSIEQPGVYELSASYPPGAIGPEVVLAVGQGIGRGILFSIGSMFAAGALFCGASVVALGLAVFTLVRRQRASDAYAVGVN